MRNDLRTWEVKTQIAKDISLGLAYLYDQGIIHCDIKSSNVVLTEYKEARICDFGHARTVGQSGEVGTLQWMAPELLQHSPEYTSKSDVYAVGMVMWEMASQSTRPYRDHTPDGMVCCTLNGVHEEYPDDTPVNYSDCIQMCWKQLSEDRLTAVDVLPTTDCSPPTHVAQDPRSARGNDDKPHYVKALRQYFKTGEGPSLMDMLEVDNRLLNGGNKALDWFNTSASGNKSAAAIFIIGRMYYEGRGVEKDYGKALEWYLAVSEAGVAAAKLKIGEMHRCGHGVEQDNDEAGSPVGSKGSASHGGTRYPAYPFRTSWKQRF